MGESVRLVRSLPVLLLSAAATPSAAARARVDQQPAVAPHPLSQTRSSSAIADVPSPVARSGAMTALGLVHLNHFFTTLDTATYEAIRSSAFIKEHFGVFETRATRRGDISYSAAYVYGSHTYMELFSRADAASLPAPNGVAFGVDAVGDLAKTAPASGVRLVTRFLGDQEIPWFENGTSPKPMAPGLISWIMEYVPEFLARWNAQTGTPGGVTRAAVLQRYAAVLHDTQATKLMDDVTGLAITATPADLDKFTAIAADFGCTVERTASGARVRTTHDVIELTVGDATRVTAAHFKLKNSPKPEQLRLGSSMLTLRADGTATWTF